jgi:hypothetical protein
VAAVRASILRTADRRSGRRGPAADATAHASSTDDTASAEDSDATRPRPAGRRGARWAVTNSPPTSAASEEWHASVGKGPLLRALLLIE